MPGHDCPNNGVLSHAYVPSIQIFLLASCKDVDGRNKPGQGHNSARTQGREISNRVPIEHILGTLQ